MKMPHPLRDYFIALSVVLCAALAYRVLIVPQLEPPIGPIAEIDVALRELAGPDLDHIFPLDSWQNQKPKFLRAEWGWVLFQESVQDSPSRWKVSPVSIVLHRREEGDAERAGEPIVLNAIEGALIEFDEPLNMVSGAKPEIKSGQLLGEVHLYNKRDSHQSHYQTLSSNHNQQFELFCRNVRIDSRQIRSSEQVRLSVGDSRLIGRDLTIKLASQKPVSMSPDSQLSMLDSLELIYLDELVVPLADGPLWQPTIDRARLQNTNGATDSQQPLYADARLNVVCDGRVVLDFATFTLRLNQRVVLQHHWGEQQYDSFACRTLEIRLVDQFDRESERTLAVADLNAPGSVGVSGPLGRVGQFVRKIIAKGSPIQADVPSLDSRMTASEIEFDAEHGKLHIRGEGDTVDLQYAGIHVAIPALDYEFDKTRPDVAGKLSIPGAGKVRIKDDSIPVHSFSWERSLQMWPEEPGNHLWIAGNVQGRTRDGGSIRTDELSVLFRMVSPNDHSFGIPDPSPAVAIADHQREPQFQLDTMRAKGQVQIDTSEIAANTDLLVVLFEHRANKEVRTDSLANADSSLGPRLNAASGPRQRLWVMDPGSATKGTAVGRRGPVNPIASPRPTLSGSTITANLILSENEIQTYDLSVSKNVKLTHELQTKTERLPLVYTGDSLRLITGSGDDQVQITGTPARIDIGNGYFQGPFVAINGRSNIVSIRDYGTFQMPLEMMPAAGAEGARWVSPPLCNFRGELSFDGQMVEITDDVRLSGQVIIGQQAEVWNVDATASKLELALDRSIQVTQPTDAKAAKVERISLLGTNSDVVLRATKFTAQGQPLGHHVLNNPRLDFYVETGQLLGPGPGWYRSWTPTRNDSPMRSISPAGSLMAMHLAYNGGLEGNLIDQQLGFQQGVRVGMSAVPDWNTNLDAVAMSQLKLNQGTVDCDRLLVGVAATRSRQGLAELPWEIQALGGVAFRMMTEKGLVDGIAARAAYDAGSDLFVLEGSPVADAVVRNTSLTGQPLLNVSMQSFTLRPETLEINTLVKGATMSQLPVGRPPGK